MPLVQYAPFDQRMVAIIKEALSFLKFRIRQYGKSRKETVDSFYHPVINSEINKELGRIEEYDFFLDAQATRFQIEMEESVFQGHMDVIRSALEIYLGKTKEAKVKSGVTGTEFDLKIQEVERALNTEAVKKGRVDLYDKYCESVRSRERVEVFLSHSHNDKALAGKLSAFLGESEIDVFLAHENIEISTKWRSEILKHLESCDVLLALLTQNFERSSWANQEVGYVMKRIVPVVPLFFGKANLKRFGFLEAFQGISMIEESPEQSFEEILRAIQTRVRMHAY